MHRAPLSVGFCLAILLPLALPAAAGEASAYAGGPLPFWEIGLSEFDPSMPTPVALPMPTGRESYHWAWRFTFRARPNLDRLRRVYREILPTLSPRQQELLENDLASLEATLDQPLTAPLAVRLVTDKGTIVADTSNEAIRNLVERRVGTRLETVREIAARPLQPDETVRGVAIFPEVPRDAQVLEIQVTGLGRRLTPAYEPGALRGGDEKRAPTLQRVLRFRYNRMGQHPEPRLTQLRFLGKSADWLWVWTAQVYPGAPRRVELTREIDDETALERTYYYMPYRIWNNTYEEQPLTVNRAGLRVPVTWRGETIEVRMLDEGVDDYWKTLVRRESRRRIASGREADFVLDYEIPRTDSPTEAAGSEIERRILTLSETDDRVVAGSIAPGRFAAGMMILRSGPSELETTIEALIDRLRMEAIAPSSRAPSALLSGYLTLRPDVPAGTPSWKRPPEPDAEIVTQYLTDLAQEELDVRGIPVTGAHTRRWGELAPVGVLLETLAEEELGARIEEGVLDVSFSVVRNGLSESSTFPVHVRRVLPEAWMPSPPPGTDEISASLAE